MPQFIIMVLLKVIVIVVLLKYGYANIQKLLRTLQRLSISNQTTLMLIGGAVEHIRNPATYLRPGVTCKKPCALPLIKTTRLL